jgi:hypothetical protein
MLRAGVAPYVEAVLGERYSYAQAMGFLAAAVFLIGVVVISVEPEAHGVTFRKSAAE